jgi:hypothetical protein
VKATGKVERKVWAQEIEKIIRFCNEHPGSRTRMREIFDKAAKRKVNRLVFEGWLRDDPAKRNEPIAGTALLLLDVARKLMAETRK